MILILDDEAPHRLLIRRALKPWKTERIEESSSIGDATLCIDEHFSDLRLIISDLNLDGVTSHALIRKIRVRASRESLPIIVLSTSPLDIDVWESYRSGANIYLVKSVDTTEFASSVQSAVKFLMLPV